MNADKIKLYDTTLRDGTQQWGMSLTVNDKLKITRLLDEFGIPYIEGGWPGANPKDSEYFRRVRALTLKQAKIAAFGSTRRAGSKAEDDRNLLALLHAETPVVTLVGKTWNLHVERVLETTLGENLKMITESVYFMKAQGREVVFDAEHFFDGYKADPRYSLEVLRAAAEGGADWLVLCDTNGGSLPFDVDQIVRQVAAEIKTPLGIHTHNDGGVAAANALAGVTAGCRQVQGTMNGYGERCGNADLVTLIPNLQLKLGLVCVSDQDLKNLTFVSRSISGIANMNDNPHAPYVGANAFAHKGGIHVAAVEKITESYEHVSPDAVGNLRNIVISELSGRGNVRVLAAELGLNIEGHEAEILDRIKDLEQQGYQFENAEGSFELIIRRGEESYEPPFSVQDIMVVSEQKPHNELCVQATVKLTVAGNKMHTAAEGDGPVHALDRALRKALVPYYPELEHVHLSDYKVRILDPDKATKAVTRVLVEAAFDGELWSTVGVSKNIIDASFQALTESYELFLLRRKAAQRLKKKIEA